MKKVLAFLLCLIFSLPLFASELNSDQTIPTIAGVKVGITQKALKAKYKDILPETQQKDFLIYSKLLVNLRYAKQCAYVFYENKFYIIAIVLEKTSLSTTMIPEAYSYYKNILSAKYGAGESRDEAALFRNKKRLLNGSEQVEIDLGTVWETGNFEIVLSHNEVNDEFVTMLMCGYLPIFEETDIDSYKFILDSLL